jgi:hypothetical protein
MYHLYIQGQIMHIIALNIYIIFRYYKGEKNIKKKIFNYFNNYLI